MPLGEEETGRRGSQCRRTTCETGEWLSQMTCKINAAGSEAKVLVLQHYLVLYVHLKMFKASGGGGSFTNGACLRQFCLHFVCDIADPLMGGS